MEKSAAFVGDGRKQTPGGDIRRHAENSAKGKNVKWCQVRILLIGQRWEYYISSCLFEEAVALLPHARDVAVFAPQYRWKHQWVWGETIRILSWNNMFEKDYRRLLSIRGWGWLN